MASMEDDDTAIQGESDGERLARMGTDAQLWAEEFIKQHGYAPGINEHLMFSWFASAIETGRSAGFEKHFDAADTTWTPATSADFNEVIVHQPAREEWETLIIEVPKPDDFPNNQWFRFKAQVWMHVADLVEQFGLWATKVSVLEDAKARLKAFREEALKDPKIAKNVCDLCELDRLNPVHRLPVVKGYHQFMERATVEDVEGEQT